ncbi:hypothetical protein L0938_12560 [Paracidovorax citrulli]
MSRTPVPVGPQLAMPQAKAVVVVVVVAVAVAVAVASRTHFQMDPNHEIV